MAVEAAFAVGDGVFDTPLPGVPFADPRDAVGQECEAGLVAWQARMVHDEWRRACWMLETARARADTLERWPEPDPRVIAARLGWSVAMAASRLETAVGALERLPRLGEAMREGRVEHAKAAVFVAGLRDVTDEQARVVVDALISQAPRLGVWELQQRIAAAVKDVDPLGAENRRDAAVARSRVSTRIAPSGAAEIHGLDLDPGMAVPAFERIVAIAEEALSQLKAAGNSVGPAKVQAQVYLRLLHGCPHGSDDLAVLEQVVLDLTTPAGPADDLDDLTDLDDLPDPDDGPSDDEDPDDGPDDGPHDDGPHDDGPHDDGPPDGGPSDGGPSDGGPSDGGPSDGGPSDGGPSDGAPDDTGPGEGPDVAASARGARSDGDPTPRADGGSSADGPDDPAADSHPDYARPSDGGLDARPDAGRGSTHAFGAAITGCADAPSPAWDTGSPPAWRPGDPEPDPPPPDTPDPRVPTTEPPPDVAARWTQRGLVFPPDTLRATLACVLGLERAHGRIGAGTLTGWDAYRAAWARTCAQFRVLLYDPDGALEHVLLVKAPQQPGADPRYRRQVVELTAHTSEVDTLDPDRQLIGIWAELARRTQHALATARARPPREHPSRSTREAGHRFPGAELTRWIHARDQICRFPMCTVPAVACPIDHTHDHTYGGPTQADNLGPLSVGDHVRKHDPTSGWTVRQTRPGRFVWTAPTGTHHVVEPDPYRPLRPVRRDRFDHGITDTRTEPRPTRPWQPRTDQHGHLTDAQRQTLHDLDQRRRRQQNQPPNPYDDDPPF
ncbi:DUF222 domain-containing protein [Actinomycetospora sp. NBRC 106378]|uniref:DUF222 domain-containing protein n=1 Tax=Actinomycetospora sp. NBRC 106378 TaxID=3032208 RepID=UPI0024A07BE7|nr:DUF222 domain-containing protein [Actinomycetospora sp. NBRC 106378]GLZ54626.1 hypothetical protein Acsp07_42430 [Actinomycetospora sp. NBRC 106378]